MGVKKGRRKRKKLAKGNRIRYHDQDTGIEMVKVGGKWVPDTGQPSDGEKMKPLPHGAIRMKGWEGQTAARDRPACPICGTKAPGAMCLSALWGVMVHEACLLAWPDGVKVPACSVCGNAKLAPMVLDAAGKAVHQHCLEVSARQRRRPYGCPQMEGDKVGLRGAVPNMRLLDFILEARDGHREEKKAPGGVKRRRRTGGVKRRRRSETEQWYDGIAGG